MGNPRESYVNGTTRFNETLLLALLRVVGHESHKIRTEQRDNEMVKRRTPVKSEKKSLPTSSLKRRIRKQHLSEGASPKKKKKKPMRFFTTRHAFGVSTATCYKPDKEEAGYTGPVTNVLRGKDEEAKKLLKKYKADFMCKRRDPAKPGNEDMKQDAESEYAWEQLSRIYEDEEENTPENNREWIENGALLEDLNHRGSLSFAEGGFRYKTSFEYAGDDTHDPPMPFDYYFLDEDVIRLAKSIFSENTLSEIADDAGTVSMLFRDPERGMAVLRSYEEDENEDENDAS